MKRLLSFVFVGVSVVAVASAQITVRQGGMKMPGLLETGSSYLLAPSVQKELHLSPAIVSKATATFQESVKMMTPQKGGPSDATARQKQFMTAYQDAMKNQAKIVAMLNPAQKTRLKQIVLQQLGASGMLHPEVKPVMKITPDEERKIGAILRDGMQMMFKGFQSNSPNQDFKARMADMQKRQKEWRGKMIALSLKVLTPAQRTQWQSLCGKPFNLDFSSMMGSFGGPVSSVRRVSKG